MADIKPNMACNEESAGAESRSWEIKDMAADV